jgi:hypothetical protein
MTNPTINEMLRQMRLINERRDIPSKPKKEDMIYTPGPTRTSGRDKGTLIDSRQPMNGKSKMDTKVYPTDLKKLNKALIEHEKGEDNSIKILQKAIENMPKKAGSDIFSIYENLNDVPLIKKIVNDLKKIDEKKENTFIKGLEDKYHIQQGQPDKPETIDRKAKPDKPDAGKGQKKDQPIDPQHVSKELLPAPKEDIPMIPTSPKEGQDKQNKLKPETPPAQP